MVVDNPTKEFKLRGARKRVKRGETVFGTTANKVPTEMLFTGVAVSTRSVMRAMAMPETMVWELISVGNLIGSNQSLPIVRIKHG